MSADEKADAPSDMEKFRAVVEDMTQSLSSARESLKPLLSQLRSTPDLDLTPGISLLTLKNHILLSYLQSLVLLSSHKLLGHSLESRTTPSKPFAAPDREPRGEQAGDLVDALIEGRVTLERVKTLEGRMKYQIDKLVRAATERKTSGNDATDDPLSFRPNIENFTGGMSDAGDASADEDQTGGDRAGIYQPPRVAPMPYTEGPKARKRAPPVPSTLSALAMTDLSNPHMESATGLGNTPSMSSKRAKELQRMTQFEEENMTRLVMNRKEERRRRQDEEDIALGGRGVRGRGRRSGGLEDEFEDVIRAVGTVGRPGVSSDGYEELRRKGRKEGVLERSRKRPVEEVDGGTRDRRENKRGRFAQEVKANRKREVRKVR